MASEPIPEPLTNQEVKSSEEADFLSNGRPELVDGDPPINAERELPPAPPTAEWKDAAQSKLNDLKRSASRAGKTASRTVQQAKEQAAAAASLAGAQATDFYRDSKIALDRAWHRARTRSAVVLDEYPLHVIAGVAAAAFLAGVALRIWRSNRDA